MKYEGGTIILDIKFKEAVKYIRDEEIDNICLCSNDKLVFYKHEECVGSIKALNRLRFINVPDVEYILIPLDEYNCVCNHTGSICIDVINKFESKFKNQPKDKYFSCTSCGSRLNANILEFPLCFCGHPIKLKISKDYKVYLENLRIKIYNASRDDDYIANSSCMILKIKETITDDEMPF